MQTPQRALDKFVVLGATGFIGAAILRFLREDDRRTVAGYGSSLDLVSPEAWQALARAVDEHTTMIVAARSRRPTRSADYLLEDMAIAANVARCLETKKIKKCVLLSSPSVYGDTKTQMSITEETRVNPNSLYEMAKWAGEVIVTEAAMRASVPLLVLRPSMAYGPGDQGLAYGPGKFIRSAVREGKIALFGDGSEKRDYIFIDDLAKIVIRLSLGPQGGVFNIASDQNYSFKDVVSRLKKIIHEGFRVESVQRECPKTSLRLKADKLLRQLKGFRFTPFEIGLKKAYDFDVRNSGPVNEHKSLVLKNL